jgi:hypothetical protein
MHQVFFNALDDPAIVLEHGEVQKTKLT